MTDILKNAALAFSFLSIAGIIFSLITTGIGIVYNLSSTVHPADKHQSTELAKMVSLITVALTLIALLCGALFLASTISDSMTALCTSLHGLINCQP